jgi:hypothetical protein
MLEGIRLENLKERDHAEDQGVGMRVNIRMHLREIGWKFRTGFIWLRIGTNRRLL